MIKINTPLIIRADQTTLGEFEQQAISNFASHVYNLWWDQTEGNNKEENTIYSLGFYKTFYDKTAKNKFEINPKNINFEMLITDVYDKVQEHVCFLDALNSKTQGNPPEVKMCLAKDIKDYKKLFGVGEFPYILIRAFRLGNTEYFCYTITR